jgi:hypothetical protein
MKSKMPERYYQKQREARRAKAMDWARAIGRKSRHDEDPEGSNFWVEHGYWPETKEAKD